MKLFLFGIFTVPFLMKLLWNVILPYWAIISDFSSKGVEDSNGEGGVSLMLYVEWASLALSCLFSWLMSEEADLWRLKNVFLIEIGLILFSYAHFFLVLFVGHLFARLTGRL